MSNFGRLIGFIIPCLALACSDSKKGNDGPKENPVVLHLEVTPPAATFTAVGETQALTVRAFDQFGVEQPLPGELVFTSSRPEIATAGSDGVVTAKATLGSAAIDVRAGEVVGPPVTVLAIKTYPGVVMVRDDQIAAGPVAVGDTAPDRVRLTLRNAGPVVVGSFVIGSGGAAFLGRVAVASGPADALVIEVEPVDSNDLISDLDMKFAFEPAQVNAMALLTAAGPSAQAMQLRADTVNFPPFACKSEVSLAAVQAELEATLNTPNISFQVEHVITEHERMATAVVARGELGAEVKAVFRLGATLTGGVSCEVTLGRITAPVFGLASVIIAPSLPVAMELSLESEVSYAAFSFGFDDQMSATADVGVVCDDDDCKFHTTFDVDNELTPVATFPGEQGPRATVSAFAGLTSGLDASFGNLGIAALGRLSVLKLSAGPELEAKIAGPFTAIGDAAFETGYELKIKYAVEPGEDIAEAVARLANGYSSNVSAKVETQLASSPKETRLSIDHNEYDAGEVVAFTVELDPASLTFPVLGPNLTQLRVYAVDWLGASATEIARVPASASESTYTLTWTADAHGNAIDPVTAKPHFYAFVVDAGLEPISNLLPFELGAFGGGQSPQHIAALGSSSLVLQSGGTIAARGRNNGGQLGTLIVEIGRVSGGSLVEGLDHQASVTGAGWFGASLSATGVLSVWGYGPNIGQPQTDNPLPIVLDDGQAIKTMGISAGYGHCVVLKEGGAVWAFGANDTGAMGNVSFYGDIGLGPAIAVAGGGTFSLALHPDGTVWGIGSGDYLQLGDDYPSGSATPVQIAGLANIVAISAGDRYGMALASDGSVWTWGRGDHGTRGDGTMVEKMGTPVKLGLTRVSQISAGDNHALALSGHTVYAWGMGQYGRVGNGGTDDVIVPTPVLQGAVEIDGGEFHSLALMTDGSVWGWGWNYDSALDSQEPNERPSPLQLSIHR